MEGATYRHKNKKPGFYLYIEEVDRENEKVKYSRTGLKGLNLDVVDRMEGKNNWLPFENFKMFWTRL